MDGGTDSAQPRCGSAQRPHPRHHRTTHETPAARLGRVPQPTPGHGRRIDVPVHGRLRRFGIFPHALLPGDAGPQPPRHRARLRHPLPRGAGGNYARGSPGDEGGAAHDDGHRTGDRSPRRRGDRCRRRCPHRLDRRVRPRAPLQPRAGHRLHDDVRDRDHRRRRVSAGLRGRSRNRRSADRRGDRPRRAHHVDHGDVGSEPEYRNDRDRRDHRSRSARRTPRPREAAHRAVRSAARPLARELAGASPRSSDASARWIQCESGPDFESDAPR